MITSTSNQKVKDLAQLIKKSRERKKQGLFVVEGFRMVQETPEKLLRELFVSETFCTKEEYLTLQELFPGKRLEILSDHVFQTVSDTQTPQGVLAVVQCPAYELKELTPAKNGLFLVLESLQDPGNLGTIFRTAEGAGVTGIIMNRSTVDIFNPKTTRSTMGSIYRVPFVITEELPAAVAELKKQHIQVYAAHLKGQKDYDKMDYVSGTAFLIGNEGNGLTEETAALADTYVKIPMAGKLESLNAAMAAGILMYEAGRQRRNA